MPRVRPAPAPLPAATLLQLMWLASPALPVGGFSYSEGLEAAVEAGHVTNEAQAADWLDDQLTLALGRADLAVVARSAQAWQRGDVARVTELNDWVRLTRESSELRQQTEQMGRSLQDWLRQRAPTDPRVAALGALRPAPCLADGFGWAENMAQAAIKSVPLGQSAGQRILARLSQRLPVVVDQALALPESAWQAFTPGLAILSARHEAQYSRLFRS